MPRENGTCLNCNIYKSSKMTDSLLTPTAEIIPSLTSRIEGTSRIIGELGSVPLDVHFFALYFLTLFYQNQMTVDLPRLPGIKIQVYYSFCLHICYGGLNSHRPDIQNIHYASFQIRPLQSGQMYGPLQYKKKRKKRKRRKESKFNAEQKADFLGTFMNPSLSIPISRPSSESTLSCNNSPGCRGPLVMQSEANLT